MLLTGATNTQPNPVKKRVYTTDMMYKLTIYKPEADKKEIIMSLKQEEIWAMIWDRYQTKIIVKIEEYGENTEHKRGSKKKTRTNTNKTIQ